MYWNIFLLITVVQLIQCGFVVPPSEEDLDWWQRSIIYEIFPLSFKDSNNDGNGDFKGIIEKLDYLVDLEVTAIWLTPFLESPMESGGYDITNYYKIQPIYGTMEDFKNLINTAHQKNIKVIMDFVPNHSSHKHPWFQKSVLREGKYSEYYIWKNATNQDEVLKNNSVIPIVPNNWKKLYLDGGDNSAWTWHNTRKQFYFTQFLGGLPDLNYRNNDVHQEMKTILKYWIKLGIDGICINALKHVYESSSLLNETVIDPNKFVDYSNLYHTYTVDQEEVYDLIKEWHNVFEEFQIKDNIKRIIMTESWSPTNVLLKYYNSGAEIPTNFELLLGNTPSDFNRALNNWLPNMPKNAMYNVVFQNHDTSRTATRFGNWLVDGFNALSLFLPGVSIVYYGGEIGMADSKDSTNKSRSPMQWDDSKNAGFTKNDTPWLFVNSDFKVKNVLNENNNPQSHLQFFKSLSKLRQTKTLTRGELESYVFNETVFVIRRFLPDNENYTLVINMDSNSQNISLSDLSSNFHHHLTVILASSHSNYSVGNMISTKSFMLTPGSSIIATDKYDCFTDPKNSSFGDQLNVKFKVLLLFLLVNKICNFIK